MRGGRSLGVALALALVLGGGHGDAGAINVPNVLGKATRVDRRKPKRSSSFALPSLSRLGRVGPQLCLAMTLTLGVLLPGQVAADEARLPPAKPARVWSSDPGIAVIRGPKKIILREDGVTVREDGVTVIRNSHTKTLNTDRGDLPQMTSQHWSWLFGASDIVEKSGYGWRVRPVAARGKKAKEEFHPAMDFGRRATHKNRYPDIGLRIPEGDGNSGLRVLWTGRARYSGPYCVIAGFSIGGETFAAFFAHGKRRYKNVGDWVGDDPLVNIGERGRTTGPNVHLALHTVGGEFKERIDKALAGGPLSPDLTPAYVKTAFFSKKDCAVVNPAEVFARLFVDRAPNDTAVAQHLGGPTAGDVLR